MTTYVVGPVNGDIESLRYAMHQLDINDDDTLWFSGNVIGEYQGNLGLLELIKSLGKRAVMVLGCNELDFLAMAERDERSDESSDYDDLLNAESLTAWCKWLALRPFVHYQDDYLLVHAGIPAEWSLSQVRTFAIEAESSLSMGNRKTFFEYVSVGGQSRWHAKLSGWKRTRFIVNALTRMSYFDEDGRSDFALNPLSKNIYSGLKPWYLMQNRVLNQQKIITAHALLPANLIPDFIHPLVNKNDESMLKVMVLSEKNDVFSFFRKR